MRAVVAALVAVLMLLAGCSAEPSGAPNVHGDDGSGDADAGAAELVELKKGSGIENCPKAQTTEGGLPEVTLPCLGGGRDVDLSTLQGPLVLNFFFGTCEPCREEMPVLEAFHQKYGDQVPIVGVDSMDSFPGEAIKLAKDRGVTYPIVADLLGDLQGSELSVRGMPTFFFLSEDGKISRAQGGLTSEEEIIKLVEDKLGVDL